MSGGSVRGSEGEADLRSTESARSGAPAADAVALAERCRAVVADYRGVLGAWLFGSASRGRLSPDSDVDVGLWVGAGFDLSARAALWADLASALGREVDLVVLSCETNPALAGDVVTGLPVVTGDGVEWLEFVLARTREAEEWEGFIVAFYRERQRSRGLGAMAERSPRLTAAQKDALVRRMEFCRQEIGDLQGYRGLTAEAYQADRSARRNVDRIAETVVNAVIDMAKTLVAACEGGVPQSYADAIRTLGRLQLIPQELADRLATLTALRTALAHEYLDLKWPWVQRFIESGHEDVLEFIRYVEGFVTGPGTPT